MHSSFKCASITTHDPQNIFDQISHEPLPEIEENVNSLLVGGDCLTQMALILAIRDWVKKELIPRHLPEGVIMKPPSDYNRAYFPTREDIRFMACTAKIKERDFPLDQDAVEIFLKEAKKCKQLDFYL